VTGIAAGHRVYGTPKIDSAVIRGVNEDEIADLIERQAANAEVGSSTWMSAAPRWTPDGWSRSARC
jgi:hypothetical protein